MLRIYILFASLAFCTAFFSCNKAESQQEVDGQKQYYYPPVSGSIWETESAEKLGWKLDKLNDLISYVDSNNSRAFIILYKGKIVVEKYWRGFGLTSSERIFSATKSMGSFLIGQAQEQGKLKISDRVSDYIGKGWSRASTAQEDNITIQHLISMTSGLNENLTYNVPAGTKWYYNTIAYHKIYQIMAAAYGMNNDQYTSQQLWNKIGMQDAYWDTEPGGGPTMSCSARDMARFGLMILSDGKWEGTPLMNDTEYFNSMLHSSQTLNPSYGYLWWLNGKSSYILPGTSGEIYNTKLMPAAPDDLVAALGALDKKIYVVKSRDLVVIRHGPASNAPAALASSSFDNEIWKRLMQAIE